MNVYPATYEPTITPPAAPTPAAERERSFYGDAIWPDGYPGRRAIRRPAPGAAFERAKTLAEPIRPPVIVDRETGAELRKPTSLSRIGHWTQILEAQAAKR